MQSLDRRTFLVGLTGGLAGVGLGRPASFVAAAPARPAAAGTPRGCWLDVAAPFIVSDPGLGLSTELLLTATSFPGRDGFRSDAHATRYEVVLYDARGTEINLGGNGSRVVSAMRPTLIEMNQVLDGRPFWGSARVRLAPTGNDLSHAGDLFSAGFVRWHGARNFDNVHAHPAAPDRSRGRFLYSMPFPSLAEYHCALALFNPNEDESAGVVRFVDRAGRTAGERRYALAPFQSTLFSLGDMRPASSPGEALAPVVPDPALRDGGVLVVINDTDAVTFGYTFMTSRQGGVFSVEHPLHFQDVPVKPARSSPYGQSGNFPADALLFTPLIFAGARVGGVELESRVYFSASRWVEEVLWLMPFVSNDRGTVDWSSTRDSSLASRVRPSEMAQQGVLRLGAFQSCSIDAADLPLPAGRGGGLGVATTPRTSHSLMKVEVRARTWGRACFSHFRPGGATHARYRDVTGRGGVASDYIVSGCQVRRGAGRMLYDCLLAVMNIEFADETVGRPRLQLFGDGGLVAERQLDDFPPLACRHLLLSELFPDLVTEPGHPLTARLLDDAAPMIMSALHLDYERRDLAIDHGSDRHSTYLDYSC